MLFSSPEITLIVFVTGLCIGSFLNVCIYRIPESKSIVSPPSSCPQCGYRIRYYDNIPVISYLLLRGKCRQCHVPISFRYPMVELTAGFFALWVYFRFGLTLEALIHFVFISVLLVITFIDMDHRIIPDVISLPGIPLFFLASFAVPSLTYKDSLLGIILGGGSLYMVALSYLLLTKREGMGGGDIKLLAMMGGLLGWQGVLFTIFVSSAIGTVIGTAIMLARHKNMKLALPFGPFLALGAVIYIFLDRH
ncbi:MAG: prepilin peptidase [Desulfobacterales bacterium]